jgi:hypothetical protein
MEAGQGTRAKDKGTQEKHKDVRMRSCGWMKKGVINTGDFLENNFVSS